MFCFEYAVQGGYTLGFQAGCYFCAQPKLGGCRVARVLYGVPQNLKLEGWRI